MHNLLFLRIWRNKLFALIRGNPVTIVFPIAAAAVIVFASIKLTMLNVETITTVGKNTLIVNTILTQSVISSNIITLGLSTMLFYLLKNNIGQSKILLVLPISNFRILCMEILPLFLLKLLLITAIYLPTQFYILLETNTLTITNWFIYLFMFYVSNIGVMFVIFSLIYSMHNSASHLARLLRIQMLHEPLTIMLIGLTAYIFKLTIIDTNLYTTLTNHPDALVTAISALLYFLIIFLLFYLSSFTKRAALYMESKLLHRIPFYKWYPGNIFLMETKRNLRDTHRILTASFLLLLFLFLLYYFKTDTSNFSVLLVQFLPFLAIEVMLLFPLIAAGRDGKRKHLLVLLPANYLTYISAKLFYYIAGTVLLASAFNFLQNILINGESALSISMLFTSEVILLTIAAFFIGTYLPFDSQSGVFEGIGLLCIFMVYFLLSTGMNSIAFYSPLTVLLCSGLLYSSYVIFSKKTSVTGAA